jgi:hypothetical protein
MRLKMATLNHSDKSAEIRRLFAELDQAYVRIADSVPPELLGADTGASKKFLEATTQASGIIKRIRELQGL